MQTTETARSTGIKISIIRFDERQGLSVSPFHRHRRAGLEDLDRRIQDLSRMRGSLESLLSKVCNPSELVEYPIIQALAG